METDEDRRQREEDDREQDELRRTAYEAWLAGGSVARHDLDDLALRAAAQHAQVIGDTASERQIDSLLEGREARREARRG